MLFRLPNVTVKHAETDKPELEVADDPDDVRTLEVASVPLTVTLCKIGEQNFVVDPTLQEESCVAAALMVAVNKKGNICLIQKNRHNALQTAQVTSMISVVRKVRDPRLILSLSLLFRPLKKLPSPKSPNSTAYSHSRTRQTPPSRASCSRKSDYEHKSKNAGFWLRKTKRDYLETVILKEHCGSAGMSTVTVAMMPRLASAPRITPVGRAVYSLARANVSAEVILLGGDMRTNHRKARSCRTYVPFNRAY